MENTGKILEESHEARKKGGKVMKKEVFRTKIEAKNVEKVKE